MLGKTHVAIGVAASLALTTPDTMPEVISAIAGGAIGGWISDIDLNDISFGSEESEGKLGGFILTAAVTATSLFIDYRVGGGVCDYVISNFGIKTITGVLIIIAGVIYGLAVSSHRTFTHSIFALVMFTYAVHISCQPMALPFCIGMVSHLILDLPNKTGMQLLFPVKKRFCLNACPSNGKANSVLMGVGTIISCILAGWLLINTFPAERLNQYHSSGSLPWFTSFQWYLIIINTISFVVMQVDHLIYDISDSYAGDGEQQELIHTIENLLALAGGGLGMLIAFVTLGEKIGKHNANWYVVVISQVLCWIVIYFVVCDPFHMGMAGIQGGWKHHVLLVAYYAIINMITTVVFIRDRAAFRPAWKTSELLLMLLGILGGALGGYLVIILSNSKRYSPHFGIGFPIMIAAHAFIAGYLLLSGIA